MLKSALEKENAKLKEANRILRESIMRIRQNALECIPAGKVMNNIWTIEETTTTLTKAEGALK